VAAPERAEKVLTLTFSGLAFALIEGHARVFSASQSAGILSRNHAISCKSRMSLNAKDVPPAMSTVIMRDVVRIGRIGGLHGLVRPT
jgi:hypothetical protein